MSVGTIYSIKSALLSDRLQEDERHVLAALLQAGYDASEKPLGRDGILTANHLAAEVLCPLMWEAPSPSHDEETERIEIAKRRLRKVINCLIIAHGISICCEAGYGGGYYLPANKDEVEGNYHRFHRRAMTGLIKASKARKSAYADAIVQLTLGFDGRDGEDILRRIGAPRRDDGPPAWVNVVSGLLRQAKGDPEKYAEEIHRLQEEFGDIFVRRDQVAEIKRLSGELNRVLEGLRA